MGGKRYRVAQWATGHSGAHSLRRVIEHPDYELVGVYVYAETKAGRDAGELCGAALTGVRATRDIEDIVAAAPDCVLYMPSRADVDDMCRLLESGADIVTILADLHHPASLDPDVRRRIEAACERGGTSLYATGPSPGWVTEILPLALTALQRRLDRLVIEEFGDMSARRSPEMITHMFGGDPSVVDLSGAARSLSAAFAPSLRQLADALGLPLDDVTAVGTFASGTKTVTIDVATIEAGTVAAWRFEITGRRAGQPLLVFRSIWYVTRDLDADWDIRDNGWHVVVDGDAPLDLDIRFTGDRSSPVYTAQICVNAVPAVYEAPPGIRTTADLRAIAARLHGGRPEAEQSPGVPANQGHA